MVLQSSFPSPIKKNIVEFQDKWLHLAAFTVLAYLTARALRQERPEMTNMRLFLLAAGFSAFFGFSDELHQFFVPGRSASIWDWVADTIGSAIGAVILIKRK